jgi:hypothetical protein
MAGGLGVFAAERYERAGEPDAAFTDQVKPSYG